MLDFADYAMLESIDYEIAKHNKDEFGKWFWKWIKIEDMDEKYLINSIRYLVNNPPPNALTINSWSDKIKELLDELCNKYEQSFPLMDYDLLW